MNKKVQAIILGIICLLLTMGICIQIKTVQNNGTTLGSTQAESELKSQVLKMKERYENSFARLNKAEQELEKVRESVVSNDEELKKLEDQITKANILLGFTDVTGTGVTITVQDGTITQNTLNPSDLIIHDLDILAIVNELKNAGAEAIEVNGKRVVSTTAFMCDGNVITVNGEKISSPFVINAIGLPEQMATLTRPGGYLELLETRYSLEPQFTKVKKITIPKYTGVINFKFAKTNS